MKEDSALWAFEFFYHRDKMNACMHCSPVRFSEITVRLASTLATNWGEDEDWTQELAEVINRAA